MPGTYQTNDEIGKYRFSKKNPPPPTAGPRSMPFSSGKSSIKRPRDEERSDVNEELDSSHNEKHWNAYFEDSRRLAGETPLTNAPLQPLVPPPPTSIAPPQSPAEALTSYLTYLSTRSPTEILGQFEHLYARLPSVIQELRKVVAGSVDKAVQTEPPPPPRPSARSA
jgi:hypothetical protein